MGPKAAAMVAEVIDRLESRPRSTGRPPLPTLEVVEALRFFVREGVQRRELRATDSDWCPAHRDTRLQLLLKAHLCDAVAVTGLREWFCEGNEPDRQAECESP